MPPGYLRTLVALKFNLYVCIIVIAIATKSKGRFYFFLPCYSRSKTPMS